MFCNGNEWTVAYNISVSVSNTYMYTVKCILVSFTVETQRQRPSAMSQPRLGIEWSRIHKNLFQEEKSKNEHHSEKYGHARMSGLEHRLWICCDQFAWLITFILNQEMPDVLNRSVSVKQNLISEYIIIGLILNCHSNLICKNYIFIYYSIQKYLMF